MLLQYSTVRVNNGPITLGGTLNVTNNVVSPAAPSSPSSPTKPAARSSERSRTPEGATFTAGGQTFRISYLGGGTHAVHAAYGGDSTHFGGAPLPVVQVVIDFTIPTLDPRVLTALAVVLAFVAAVTMRQA